MIDSAKRGQTKSNKKSLFFSGKPPKERDFLAKFSQFLQRFSIIFITSHK